MKKACVLSAVVAMLTGCGGRTSGGSGSPTAPSATPTPTPSGSPWVTEGVRLTNADVGFSGVLADATALQLRDGRWRMFFFTGGAYRSAVSSDGLAFTMESGTRLPEAGQSRVLRLDDGRVRMYFIWRGGISSGISSDEGMTFTIEPGERVSAAAAGLPALSGPGIARTRDGRWRMYFSELPRPGAGPRPISIRSASSSDLLTWSMDVGVRIGAGATLSGSAEHPSAIANTDGSVSLFYFRNNPTAIWTSTSTDGHTFTSETSTGIGQGNDPDVVRLPGGSLRMYYNWGDDNGGAIYSARSAAAPVLMLTQPITPTVTPAPFTPVVPRLPSGAVVEPGAPTGPPQTGAEDVPPWRRKLKRR